MVASGFGQAAPVINALTAAAPGLSQVVAPLYGSGFTLTINGQNFAAGAQIQFGGTTLPANFQSGTQLTVAIPALLLTTVGTNTVTVINPGPAPNKSNGIGFFVIERGDINHNRS